ncbi:MAG: hypothetical protein ABEK50_02260, partial [bacterium]
MSPSTPPNLLTIVSIVLVEVFVGVHDDFPAGRWWTYDVDRTADGDLLVATTEPGISVVETVDPATGAHEWVDRLRTVEDADDVDAIGDGEY